MRQSARPPLAPRLRRGVSHRQVVLGGAPRPLPSGAVTCQPAVLDLGAVRRGESAAGRLSLHNAGLVTVEFRLRPPAPLLSLRVEPRAGVLEAGRQLPLLVTFEVSVLGLGRVGGGNRRQGAVRCRSYPTNGREFYLLYGALSRSCKSCYAA